MQAKQEVNETIHQYVSRLRILSEFCEFGDSVNKWIIAKVVHSCRSDKLRREFLAKPKLDYKEMIEIGRNHDNVEGQALQIEGKVEFKQESVNQIKSKPRYGARSRAPTHFSNLNRANNASNTASTTTTTTTQATSGQHARSGSRRNELHCFNCGGEYPHSGPGPAIGKTCFNCNKMNHVSNVCKSAPKGQTRAQVNKITQVASNTSDPDFVFRVTHPDHIQPVFTASISDTPIEISIDTMSSINVIDEVTYAKLKPKPALNAHKTPAYPYGSSTPIQFLGEFLSTIRVGQKCQKCFCCRQRELRQFARFPYCESPRR